MRRLKFLVIDEVSMVRSDLMWAIDQSLRINRGRPREPFGGVRLALFGDLHQLPPVVNEAEVAEHLESQYGGPFFFSVAALREGAGTSLIELDAGLPAEGRGAARACSTASATATPTRTTWPSSTSACIRSARLSDGEPYVILTPTNAAAGRINMAYLDALPGSARDLRGRHHGRVQPDARSRPTPR